MSFWELVKRSHLCELSIIFNTIYEEQGFLNVVSGANFVNDNILSPQSEKGKFFPAKTLYPYLEGGTVSY